MEKQEKQEIIIGLYSYDKYSLKNKKEKFSKWKHKKRKEKN